MRIIIHSNAPWVATGYGQQTAQLARRLKRAGHDVAISAFYGLQGSQMFWEGIPVYPQGTHPYGNDVLLAHAEQHMGDLSKGLIITLVDAWVLPAELLREANVLCWTPIDHDPAPPRVLRNLHEMECWPVAMTRHGERAMLAADLEPFYAPHGIDTNVLKPRDKAEARRRLGIPEDRFVVGMVAANKGNPSRKGFCEAFQAFAILLRKHPDALLYLHTEVLGTVDGVNLVKLAKECGIPDDAVGMMHQYHGFILGMPAEHMPWVYSAFDVLLNPAHGEGFGIPVIEAQACGVPVVVTDCTAMSELVGPGWKVPGQRWWTPQESWATCANVTELGKALIAAYRKASELSEACVRHAWEYDADLVFAKHWTPILEACAQRIGVELPDGRPPEPEPVAVEQLAA